MYFGRYIPVFLRQLLLIPSNCWYPFARLCIVIMQKLQCKSVSCITIAKSKNYRNVNVPLDLV